MKDREKNNDLAEVRLEFPHAGLEHAFIEEYLANAGHTLESVRQLPHDEARKIMIEASMYASGKLAEREKRAKMVGEVHGSRDAARQQPVGGSWAG